MERDSVPFIRTWNSPSWLSSSFSNRHMFWGQTDSTHQQPPMGLSTLTDHPSRSPHLRVLLVALVGLGQALACLAAARGARAVSLDHIVGSIAEPPLDAISLVELIYLQGQARAAVRGKRGTAWPPQCCTEVSPR